MIFAVYSFYFRGTYLFQGVINTKRSAIDTTLIINPRLVIEDQLIKVHLGWHICAVFLKNSNLDERALKHYAELAGLSPSLCISDLQARLDFTYFEED